MKVKGSLLSKETQEFNFKFASNVPGVFMETWELTIAPKLKGGRLRVSVKGFALLDDPKRFASAFALSAFIIYLITIITLYTITINIVKLLQYDFTYESNRNTSINPNN